MRTLITNGGPKILVKGINLVPRATTKAKDPIWTIKANHLGIKIWAIRTKADMVISRKTKTMKTCLIAPLLRKTWTQSMDNSKIRTKVLKILTSQLIPAKSIPRSETNQSEARMVNLNSKTLPLLTTTMPMPQSQILKLLNRMLLIHLNKMKME